MGKFGGIITHRGEIEAFEDVEDLHDMNTARARRREAHDFVASIGAPDRFARHHLVSGEVGGRDQASVSLHPLGRAAREVALVKPSHPTLGHLPVRPGQIGLAQSIARRWHCRQPLQKDGLTLGKQCQLRPRLLQSSNVMAIEPETLLGDPSRGFEKLTQRQTSIVGAGIGHRRELAGNTHRQGAILAELGINLALAHEHVPRRCGRGHLATVQGDEPSVGQAHGHEASASEARVVPVNNTKGQGTGDGRIDRIAPVPQGLQARLGGHGIHGRDETFARRGGIGGSHRTVKSNGHPKPHQHRQKARSE